MCTRTGANLNMYQDWGKPEQALEYYQKALDIDEELKDIRGKATKLNNMAVFEQPPEKVKQDKIFENVH